MDDRTRLSLSLNDLINTETDPSINQSSSVDYKGELTKLLNKSRGTSYEKTLKRFVEAKFKEIKDDEAERRSYERTDLLSLSKSKYDSPQRKRPTFLFEQQSLLAADRIEELSTPFEHHKWKGPIVSVKRVSTNHEGRQRPSPHKDDKKKKHGGKISVSLSDFSEWLNKNREWNLRHSNKVKKTKESIDNDLIRSSTPRLYSNSIKLAQVAHWKEVNQSQDKKPQRHRYGQAISSNDNDNENNEIHFSQLEIKHSPIKQAQDSSMNEPTEETKNSTENTNNNVTSNVETSIIGTYDRLADRGRRFAEKYYNWNPPDCPQSFTPEILDRSRRMVEKKELKRSLSLSNISINLNDSIQFNSYNDNSIMNHHHVFMTQQQPSSEDHYNNNQQHHQQQVKLPTFQDDSVLHINRYKHDKYAYSGASSGGNNNNDSNNTKKKSKEDDNNNDDNNVMEVSTKKPVLVGSGLSRLFSNTSSSELQSNIHKIELRLSDLKGMKDSSVNNNNSNKNNNNFSSSLDQHQQMNSSSSNNNNNTTMRSMSPGAIMRKLAEYNIERTRALSASRRQKQEEEHNRRNYIKKSTKGVNKPFQPVLVSNSASNPHAVMNTFDERVTKSVETLYIRNAIARRSPSPGPGHYNHATAVTASLTPNIPTKLLKSNERLNTSINMSLNRSEIITASSGGVYHDSNLCISPKGKQGYKFSKQPSERLNVDSFYH